MLRTGSVSMAKNVLLGMVLPFGSALGDPPIVDVAVVATSHELCPGPEARLEKRLAHRPGLLGKLRKEEQRVLLTVYCPWRGEPHEVISDDLRRYVVDDITDELSQDDFNDIADNSHTAAPLDEVIRRSKADGA